MRGKRVKKGLKFSGPSHVPLQRGRLFWLFLAGRVVPLFPLSLFQYCHKYQFMKLEPLYFPYLHPYPSIILSSFLFSSFQPLDHSSYYLLILHSLPCCLSPSCIMLPLIRTYILYFQPQDQCSYAMVYLYSSLHSFTCTA